jgi:hypothetical protein
MQESSPALSELVEQLSYKGKPKKAKISEK